MHQKQEFSNSFCELHSSFRERVSFGKKLGLTALHGSNIYDVILYL